MDNKYSTRIYWSDEYNEYIATASEFPHLTGTGDTKEESIANLEEAIEMGLELIKEEGDSTPEPVYLPEYSGKINLRMPKTLHKELAEKAEREGVSLNLYMISLLSRKEAPPITNICVLNNPDFMTQNLNAEIKKTQGNKISLNNPAFAEVEG